MKRSVILIVFFYMLFSLCACQPTPDENIVISKNDGKLEKLLQTESEMLKEKVYAPDTVQGEFSSGNVTVYVNANVQVPDIRQFPVYRVCPVELTQQSLDTYLNYFIGDSDIYESDTMARTKSEVLADIIKTQELIDGIKNEKSEIYKEVSQTRTHEQVMEYLEWLEGDEGILALQREYNEAPEEATRHIVERKLKEDDIHYSELKYAHLRGYTDDYEKFVWITATLPPYTGISRNIVFNTDAAYCRESGYYIPKIADNLRTGYRILSGNEDIKNAKHTYKEALSLAEGMLCDLDLDYSFCYATECDRHFDGKHMDYQFYFAPSIPGISAHMECYSSKSGDYIADWKSPYIIVQVSDKGAFAFSSVSSIRFDECINNNVTVLSFDEMWETAQKNIAKASDVMYDEGEMEKKVEISIDSIHLSYIKIPEKGNPAVGLCIPVWMFYGKQTDVYDVNNLSEDFQLAIDDAGKVDHDQALVRPFFCINAIDGSIIDLTQGY